MGNVANSVAIVRKNGKRFFVLYFYVCPIMYVFTARVNIMVTLSLKGKASEYFFAKSITD